MCLRREYFSVLRDIYHLRAVIYYWRAYITAEPLLKANIQHFAIKNLNSLVAGSCTQFYFMDLFDT